MSRTHGQSEACCERADVPADDLFDDIEVSLFVGPAQSGRTSRLVKAARELSAAGESVLFCCAVPEAAAGVREELAGSGVKVVPLSDFALSVLATPYAQERYGRAPRILVAHEQDILMEDMKVSQMKNRRLRGVLGYLFAGWSNLSDDSWEQTYEEDLLIERIDANLRFAGGVLACEAANLALSCVRARPDQMRESVGWDCVIVDDFNLASRAYQHLARALARRKLVVAGSPRPSVPASGEEYPCFEGLTELAVACPDCRIELLHSAQPAPILAAQKRLCADDALSVAEGAELFSCGEADAAPAGLTGSEEPGAGEGSEAFSVSMASTVEAELLFIAQTCSDAISRGEDVAIFGTDRTWRRNVVANLRRVGLPIRAAAPDRIKVRDLSDAKGSARIERDALASLRRDPGDGVAWRAMLAAGDHVGRSAAIDHLRRAVCEMGDAARSWRLPEALEALSRGEVPCDELTQPLYDDLLAAYRRARTLLADSVCDKGVRPEGNARAAGEAAEHSASICVYPVHAAPSVRADTVIFGAFVNGCIPSRDYFDPAKLAGGARERQWASSVCSAYSVAACARKRLYLCGFTSCNLEVAETMDVHIASIKLRRGIRTAAVEPSGIASIMQGE